ncbi:HTH-type transcriptional regulator ImmR [compost metagenome]
MANKIVNKILFGKRLKEAREKLNLTQFELAELVGISQNFLGDIERGLKLPSIETLIKLSNSLKISLDSMFIDSLDNIVSEPEEIYYTDRQLTIMKNVIKMVTENFKE